MTYLFVCLKYYLIINCLIFKQNYLHIYKYMHRKFLDRINGNYWQYLPLESGTEGLRRGARFTFHNCTVSLLHSLNCTVWTCTTWKCCSHNNFSNNLANMSYLILSTHSFCITACLTHCHVYLSSKRAQLPFSGNVTLTL